MADKADFHPALHFLKKRFDMDCGQQPNHHQKISIFPKRTPKKQKRIPQCKKQCGTARHSHQHGPPRPKNGKSRVLQVKNAQESPSGISQSTFCVALKAAISSRTSSISFKSRFLSCTRSIPKTESSIIG